MSLPAPAAGSWTAAFDRVWQTLRDLYYRTGAPADEWRALGERYRKEAVSARSEQDLEAAIDRLIAEQPLIKPSVVSSRAVVVSGHPLASEAGALALERGGNVVDAAIAVSFALGVVEPDASGIGGDGMAVLFLKGMGMSSPWSSITRIRRPRGRRPTTRASSGTGGWSPMVRRR